MDTKNLPNITLDEEQKKQSWEMISDDFFCIVLNREKMKLNKLEHILLADRFNNLLKSIKNQFCSYTKSKQKSSLAERYEKFNMAAFLVLSDGSNWIIIKKVISDSQKEHYTEIKRKELKNLLEYENSAVTITIDFDDEEVSSEITIDVITKQIKKTWKAYLESVQFFCNEEDKKTQMHIEKIKNRLETPWKISIQREWLIGFLKITSYQFGGKNVHK